MLCFQHNEKPADFILQIAGRRTFITRNLDIVRFEVRLLTATSISLTLLLVYSLVF